MARYVELVVQGNDRDLKGYLTGHFSTGKPPRLIYADEAGFQLHRLRERIKHGGEVQHVLVAEEDADRVRSAVKSSEPRYQFEIKDERIVETGFFSFEFKTPSRDVAAKLKQIMGALPAGVTLNNYAPKEESCADGGGTELYTPEHDYTFSGQGEIRGDLFTVVAVRRSIDEIDFTRCHEIEIADS